MDIIEFNVLFREWERRYYHGKIIEMLLYSDGSGSLCHDTLIIFTFADISELVNFLKEQMEK